MSVSLQPRLCIGEYCLHEQGFADLFFYFFDSFDLQLKFKRMRRKLFTPILKNQQNRFGFIFTAHISPVYIIDFYRFFAWFAKPVANHVEVKMNKIFTQSEIQDTMSMWMRLTNRVK